MGNTIHTSSESQELLEEQQSIVTPELDLEVGKEKGRTQTRLASLLLAGAVAVGASVKTDEAFAGQEGFYKTSLGTPTTTLSTPGIQGTPEFRSRPQVELPDSPFFELHDGEFIAKVDDAPAPYNYMIPEGFEEMEEAIKDILAKIPDGYLTDENILDAYNAVLLERSSDPEHISKWEARISEIQENPEMLQKLTRILNYYVYILQSQGGNTNPVIVEKTFTSAASVVYNSHNNPNLEGVDLARFSADWDYVTIALGGENIGRKVVFVEDEGTVGDLSQTRTIILGNFDHRNVNTMLQFGINVSPHIAPAEYVEKAGGNPHLGYVLQLMVYELYANKDEIIQYYMNKSSRWKKLVGDTEALDAKFDKYIDSLVKKFGQDKPSKSKVALMKQFSPVAYDALGQLYGWLKDSFPYMAGVGQEARMAEQEARMAEQKARMAEQDELNQRLDRIISRIGGLRLGSS